MPRGADKRNCRPTISRDRSADHYYRVLLHIDRPDLLRPLENCNLLDANRASARTAATL